MTNGASWVVEGVTRQPGRWVQRFPVLPLGGSAVLMFGEETEMEFQCSSMARAW